MTRKLALHCMTTKFGNIICPYHSYHDKTSSINDENPPNSNSVTGVPWTRVANSKSTSAENRVSQRPGILHCGCFEDDVLIDFWWWKNASLKSHSTGVVEPWRRDRLDTYERGFMVRWWSKWTGLTVNDIYSNHEDP
jgi:hypothetical protein